MAAKSLVLLLAAVANVSLAQSDTMQPVWLGTYTISGSTPSGATAAGAHLSNKVWSMKRDESTDKVVGKVGAAFGIEYAKPEKGWDGLTTVFIVPAPGLFDKSTGKYSTRLEYKTPCPSTCQSIYIFEDESEIVPGITRVELWRGTTKIHAQEFVVAK